jgi:predicted transposase/invertase (TIGR01784 family)
MHFFLWKEKCNLINKINNTRLGENMVTIVEQMKQEGREEGEQIGSLRQKIEMAKKMLMERFDLNTISRITGLSIERIKRLQ